MNTLHIMTLYINTVHMSTIACSVYGIGVYGNMAIVLTCTVNANATILMCTVNTNATIFATSPGCSEQRIKSKKKYAASKKHVRCTYFRVAKMHRICRSLSAKEPLIIGLFYRK